MALRPIVLFPDPVLLKPTQAVEEVDDEVRQLVQDMIDTMRAAPGIGLAANQVGVSSRVCIVDITGGEQPDELKVLINPEVRSFEGTDLGEEGCLSFPEITLEIERPYRAVVEALDLDGRRYTVNGEGLLARAMLHEIEHLEGQTFLRNVSSVKREMVKRRIRKLKKSGDWVAAVAG
ncbi:MAG: peptide deformylase [Acidobacteriota bacterium]|nr:peptide deformylase [Acidobacteriota bacterium]